MSCRVVLNTIVGSLVALVTTVSGVLPAVASDEVTIAVPRFSEELDIIHGSDVTARVLRGALTSGLIRERGVEGAGGGLALGLADSLVVSEGGNEWGFRLRPAASFRNGRAIRGADVSWSLNRCITVGGLPSISSVRTESKIEVGVPREWIYVRLKTPQLVFDGSPAAKEVVECPVLEKESSVVFGRILGKGGNFVGSGDFALSTFRLGKEYEVTRAPSKDPFKHGASKVTFRGIGDPELGLTAIRVGTVDAFFVDDQKVLEIARKDESLRVVNCSFYSVIVRSGFKLSCAPSMRLLEVGYVG